MSAQGASLQSFNNELVKSIEELREKREAITRHIAKDEEEKARISNDLRILTERLSRINESLAKKIAARNALETVLADTEQAYMRILESSQTLLHVLKRESVNLSKQVED